MRFACLTLDNDKVNRGVPMGLSPLVGHKVDRFCADMSTSGRIVALML